MRAALIGTVLALWLVPDAVWAQPGAFSRLPPGEQTVARALFEAQGAGGAPLTSRSLTLDEIAAKRRGGAGWGEVFREMKNRGLLMARSLGEVVSRYEKRHRWTRIAAATDGGER